MRLFAILGQASLNVLHHLHFFGFVTFRRFRFADGNCCALCQMLSDLLSASHIENRLLLIFLIKL